MPGLGILAAGAGLVIAVIAGVAFWLLWSKPVPQPVQAPPPVVHRAPAPAPATAPVAPPPPPISENGSSGPGGPTTVVIPPQLAVPAASPPPPSAPPAATQTAAPPPPKRREHRVVASARAPLKSSPPVEMKPLDGSQPEYPDAYEDSDTKGEVTVTCILQPDGSATRCQLVHVTGGEAFGSAVLHWLAQDSTRFPPLLRHGHPIALPFTWNIEFFP